MRRRIDWAYCLPLIHSTRLSSSPLCNKSKLFTTSTATAHFEANYLLSMAFLRLPSTSQLASQQSLSFSQKFSPLSQPQTPQFTNFLWNPLPHLSLSTSQISLSPLITHVQSTVGTSEIALEDEVDEASKTRVLAQNIPWSSTPNDLRPLFEKFGTVLDIELSMHNTTRNRGLAFVTMGSHEEAVEVIKNLEAFEFEGRALKLNWANPRKEKPPPVFRRSKPLPVHNLFVANLPFEARAHDLKEFFIANGASVVSAEIVFHDKPRSSAGYGFVSFNTKKESDEALNAFEGKEFMGRTIRVAQSKTFLRQETKASIQPEEVSAQL